MSLQKKELKKKQEDQELYQLEGQMTAAIPMMITLTVGVGIITLVMIFVGTLGGQTYQLTESKIDAISNATIKGHVKSSIVSSFEALEQTGDYLPIIVLAIVIAIVLSLILGFMAFGSFSSGGYGRGSAL